MSRTRRSGPSIQLVQLAKSSQGIGSCPFKMYRSIQYEDGAIGDSRHKRQNSDSIQTDRSRYPLAARGGRSCWQSATNTRRHPRFSHAILVYDRGRTTGLADGIVITPLHTPSDNGGFKYNPPNRGARGHRCHWLDRGPGQRTPEERPARREENAFREGVARCHDAPARLSQRLRERPAM